MGITGSDMPSRSPLERVETEPGASPLEKVLRTLQDHEARIVALEGKGVRVSLEGSKRTSIKEFVLTRSPHDDTQKALAIAYFKEKFEGFESFNVRDLEDGFRKAKERVPPNINDKVNHNIKNGHMMEASEKKDGLKSWTLTNTGELFVESGFEVR